MSPNLHENAERSGDLGLVQGRANSFPLESGSWVLVSDIPTSQTIISRTIELAEDVVHLSLAKVEEARRNLS